MAFLEIILFPLIYVLQFVLEAFHSLSGSYGLAIILLSCVVAVVTWPLARYAQKIEQRDKDMHEAMAPALKAARMNLKGEAQFNAIEKVYQEHKYHPIYAVKSAAGFALQLPFLLSALLLLWDHPPLIGEGFLFLTDLSTPDGLVAGINILPLVMVAITLFETRIKPEMTPAGRVKFSFITLVILFLIYPLPSAVVLYWTTSNIISLARTLLRVRKGS